VEGAVPPFLRLQNPEKNLGKERWRTDFFLSCLYALPHIFFQLVHNTHSVIKPVFAAHFLCAEQGAKPYKYRSEKDREYTYTTIWHSSIVKNNQRSKCISKSILEFGRNENKNCEVTEVNTGNRKVKKDFSDLLDWDIHCVNRPAMQRSKESIPR
jgi:hypothetical protein